MNKLADVRVVIRGGDDLALNPESVPVSTLQPQKIRSSKCYLPQHHNPSYILNQLSLNLFLRVKCVSIHSVFINGVFNNTEFSSLSIFFHAPLCLLCLSRKFLSPAYLHFSLRATTICDLSLSLFPKRKVSVVVSSWPLSCLPFHRGRRLIKSEI